MRQLNVDSTNLGYEFIWPLFRRFAFTAARAAAPILTI